jgi:hypothetical protein
MAVRVSEARSCDDGVRLSLLDLSLSVFKLYCRTCFWAGDTFAPKLRVRDGVPVQRFLQDAFLDMWEVVARAVGDLDGVLGFEVRSCPLSLSDRLTRAQMMNEPHRGYVDLPSLHGFDYNTDLHLGDVRAYTHPTTQAHA